MATKAKYDKLNKFEVYDKEAAEQLAAAMNERLELGKQAAALSELINDNEELQTFVWTTAEGVSKALHNLEDDHLANILTHLTDRGYPIPKSIKAEARRRKIALPTDATVAMQIQDYSEATKKALKLDRYGREIEF